MVAVAGDSFIVVVGYQRAALIVPPSKTVEEAEVPENTLWIHQAIVSNVKCERNITDVGSCLNKYNSAIDNVER